MKFRTIFTLTLSVALAYAQFPAYQNDQALAPIDTPATDNAITPAAPLDNGEVSENDASGSVAASGVSVDNGISSDVESPSLADGANVAAGEAAGEASDDYGDAAGVDAMDAGEASDNDTVAFQKSFNGASGEAAPKAQDLTSQSDAASAATGDRVVALDDTSKANTPIDPAKIASGLVGAAAVSSAGIFFMVKRSKRRGLESVRSQISMA